MEEITTWYWSPVKLLSPGQVLIQCDSHFYKGGLEVLSQDHCKHQNILSPVLTHRLLLQDPPWLLSLSRRLVVLHSYPYYYTTDLGSSSSFLNTFFSSVNRRSGRLSRPAFPQHTCWILWLPQYSRLSYKSSFPSHLIYLLMNQDSKGASHAESPLRHYQPLTKHLDPGFKVKISTWKMPLWASPRSFMLLHQPNSEQTAFILHDLSEQNNLFWHSHGNGLLFTWRDVHMQTLWQRPKRLTAGSFSLLHLHPLSHCCHILT